MSKKLFSLLLFIFFIFIADDARSDIASVQYVNQIVNALGNASTKDVGVANGVASLDANTKIPISQIPTGTTGTTVVLGNDSRITNSIQTSGSFTMSGTYNVTGTLNVTTPPLPPVN